MTALLTRTRPLLLAIATSLTLASCFDRDKKCDPKPTTCGPLKPATSTGSGTPN